MRSEGGVVQTFLRDRALATQGVDRHATSNDVASGAASHDAVGIDERRTVCGVEVGRVEQAIGQVVLVGAVVAITGVPIEGPVTELEVAFETAIEVPVLYVLVERAAA